MSAVTAVVVIVSFRAGEPATLATPRAARSHAAGAVTQQSPSPRAAARPSNIPTQGSADALKPQPALARSRTQQPVPVSPRPRAVPRSPVPVPAPAATQAPSSVTVNGAPADTNYGPVQVQITIRTHRIVAAHAIQYPQDTSRDRSINDRAIPQLDQETLDTQSAQIDTVSGATYTSDGYRQSLQSALDAAHSAGAW